MNVNCLVAIENDPTVSIAIILNIQSAAFTTFLMDDRLKYDFIRSNRTEFFIKAGGK